MNLRRITLTALLTAGLLAIPALAQDASTTSGSSSQTATTTDHNDTNSKTKHAMKKAGSKMKQTGEEAKEKVAKGKKLDLNSADEKDIAALPGMDDATAQKVVDNRPYKTKADLLHKKVVTMEQYNKFKKEVVARNGKSESGETAKHRTKKSSTTPATSTSGPSR